jgi:multidrug efflux pump subunit AcrA (membrane-fusion protein)
MATSNESPDPSAQTETAGMTLLSDQAKATAAEIRAENAALDEASQSAEAEAEATAEQASLMAQAAEEVLEELQEIKEGRAWPAVAPPVCAGGLAGLGPQPQAVRPSRHG